MVRRVLIRNIVLTETTREDLVFWQETSPGTVQKINALIESILEDPSSGIGKPEKLKYDLSGMWSRRINHKDRMVYEVENDTLIILQLRDHY